LNQGEEPQPSSDGASNGRFQVTDLTSLSDETLSRAFEDIRSHVSADARSGGKYRLMGQTAKTRATALFDEIQRRGLNTIPIHWPD
jgi:hypothetical protein